MKPVPALAALGLCAFLAAPALAQEPAPRVEGPASLSDFRAEVLRSDALSIASSRIALERSRDPDVRDYARRVIANRQATTDALLPPGSGDAAGLTGEGIAAGLADDGPAEPGRQAAIGPADRAAIERLRSARSLEAFERDYVGRQVRSDARMLALYGNYARNGDSAQGRRFANEALPYIAAEHDRSTLLGQRYGG